MAGDNQVHEDYSEMAVKVFDLTQKAAETWHGSCNSIGRELLEILFTNREADETTLRLTWRKPFDAVMETANLGDGVAAWNMHVPSVRSTPRRGDPIPPPPTAGAATSVRSGRYARPRERESVLYPAFQTCPCVKQSSCN